MAIRSRDFVGIAEGIKSHELSTQGKIEQLKGHISELSGKKSVLNGQISYLEAAIAAAYEDTDEDGDPDYGRISVLESQIGMAENQLSVVEQQLDTASGELGHTQSELERVQEEKERTLFEIQERARTTSQNIALAGGMFGAYAGVGGALQNSMQTSLSALSQAANILGGSVSEIAAGGSGRSLSGSGSITSGAGVISQGNISTSPLVAFTAGTTGAGGGVAALPSPSQFASGQAGQSTPGTLPNYHSGQATINSQKPQNFSSEQASNLYIASALEVAFDQSTTSDAKSFQSDQVSPKIEDSLRSSSEKRRQFVEKYRVHFTPRPTRANTTGSTGDPSRGQRERQLGEEIEFEGVGQSYRERRAFSHSDKNFVKSIRRDIEHYRNNESLYIYNDYSKNPSLVFVDPRSVIGVQKRKDSFFWEYKGSAAKEKYMELAGEIPTVNFLHNVKKMSYEQIALLGGTLAACVQQYYTENAIRIEKIGNAYIFQGDGRHRFQAAIEAGINNIPVLIVGEHKIAPRINGVKQGNKMSFAEADSGSVNPKYGTDIGYSKNCQSCVVTFEARLRGYDVQVLPNTRGSVLEYLSRNCNLAWIDPETGKPPEYIFDSSLTSASEYLNFVRDKVVQGNRYTIQFAWKGRGNCGHIVNLDRTNDGQLRIKDNQRGPGERSEWIGDTEVLEYLSRMKYYDFTILGDKYSCVPKLLRIDNMEFNNDVVDYIMEGVQDD